MQEALSTLLGEEAKGLSPAVLGRLKAEWAQEHAQWQRRSLQGKRYAYWWADGVYTNLRAADDPRMCLLVIIGVTAEGKKEVAAVTDGLRESKASWRRSCETYATADCRRRRYWPLAMGRWVSGPP